MAYILPAARQWSLAQPAVALRCARDWIRLGRMADKTASGCITIPTSVDAPLLIHGDNLDVLPGIPACSVDGYVSDPPSAEFFMSAEWDRFKAYEPRTARGREVLSSLTVLGMPAKHAGFVSFMVEHWVEVLRVLKPGAYAVAWALPKTSDLAGLAMRLAGFVPDNPLLHLFSSAMAKGANPGKKIDAMFGAEREVVFVRERQGFTPTRDGITNYDRGEVGGPKTDVEITAPATDLAARFEDWNSQLAPGFENWLVGQKPIEGATPPRLRELTGLDYAWSPRKVKTDKARRQVAKDFVDALSGLEAGEGDWAAAVRWADALSGLEARGACQRRSGRSLRPGHPNIEQLLMGGAVVAERERGKYSGAPIETIAANCIAHGVGAYHIGACRIPRGSKAEFPEGVVSETERVYGDGDGRYGDRPRGGDEHPTDGYPKTVLVTTGGERCPAKALDAQSGESKDGGGSQGGKRVFTDAIRGGDKIQSFGGSGGASRFYTNLPIDDSDLDRFAYKPKARHRDAGLRSDIENDHNTLKTVALMRWIIRLVCPPGGVILSTFGGSGTDAVAAIAEGMRVVIMERRADYYELMCSRVAAALGSPEAAAEANDVAPVGGQLALL